jgi:seryl-tRNA synthetase
VAAVDDGDDIGDALGFVEVVRREQHAGTAAREVGDDLAYHEAGLRIDAGARLVEKDNVGPADQGKGEGEPLLFASGEATPGGSSNGGKADPVEERVGLRRSRVVGGGETERVAGVHARVHAAALEHHPDAGRKLLAVAARVESEDADLARRRGAVALERLDRACLARSIGAEESVDVAGVGLQGDAGNGDDGAIPHHERRNLDGGHGSARYFAPTMIDVRRLRTELDDAKAALARKGVPAEDVQRAADLDAELRELSSKRDELRSQVNALSKQVGQAKKAGHDAEAEAFRAQSSELGVAADAAKLEAEAVEQELRELLLRIPNLPAPEAPDGASEADNVVVRVEGFDPDGYAEHQRVPHWDVGAELGILDLEAGAKISGSMFPVLRAGGATLSRALCQYALDYNADAFEEIRPPTLVRTETLTATGQLPKFADDSYYIPRDDLWAIPTAEVPLTSLARDEILSEADLPVRLMACTPSYRREAGAHGRDTRGLLRVHEFDKVEILGYCTPEQAGKFHVDLVSRAEHVLSALGLAYRVVEICTGDLGQSHARCFDLEVYAPGCDMWLEASSVSWFTDYQARRANIRYRPASGGTAFVHTLNGSALAVPRVWAAIVENNRQGDGSVRVPEVLWPYMRGAKEIRRA